MIDALQQGKVVVVVSDPVHFPDGKCLADDLNAGPLGAAPGSHIDMGHIVKSSDLLPVKPVELCRQISGALYILCRNGKTVDICVLQIIQTIDMRLQIILLLQSIDRVIGLNDGAHGCRDPVIDALYKIKREALSEEDLFLSVEDQGACGQNIEIRPDPGPDHIAHTHQGAAGAETEQSAPLLKIDDPENIGSPHGFLVAHKIQGIIKIACNGSAGGRALNSPVPVRLSAVQIHHSQYSNLYSNRFSSQFQIDLPNRFLIGFPNRFSNYSGLPALPGGRLFWTKKQKMTGRQ
jgi:hypothetical protein